MKKTLVIAKIFFFMAMPLVVLIGLIAFLKGNDKSEGYYKQSDMSEYNRGYNEGRENFRQVVIELNRDQNNTYKIKLPR